MGFFDFLKPAVKTQLLFSEIEVDMHSHLVPGIDDGVKTIEESLLILKEMADLGYRKIITTPHINFDYYPNTRDGILFGFEEVKNVLEKSDIQLEIDVAAEYYVDEHFYQLLNKKELMTFSGNNVLIEFPFVYEPMNVQNVLFDMQANGYQPILAHYERYLYWHNHADKLDQLKEWGTKVQLNLNSLSGHYTKDIKKQADFFVKSGKVDFVASDCHRIQHIHLMKKLTANPMFHKIKERNILLNSEL